MSSLIPNLQSQNRMRIKKVFGYVVRQDGGLPQLLAFASSDGRGYEIIRGHVDPGETAATAVLREIEEESGLSDVQIVKQLGVAHWQNEEQTFFLCTTTGLHPAAFSHRVTGDGGDEGAVFDFCWLDMNEALDTKLLFGGERFVAELLRYFNQKGGTHF